MLSVGAGGPPSTGAFSSANACGTPLVIEAVIP